MAPNSLPRASFPRLAVAIHHALRAEATAAAPALASNGSSAYPCRTAPRTRNERTAGMKDVKRAWQRMLSGRRLDLPAPSPVDIELEEIAHGLARCARWTGQSYGAVAFSRSDKRRLGKGRVGKSRVRTVR